MTIENIVETETSLVAFGTRERQSVVLKIVKKKGTSGILELYWMHSTDTESLAFMSTSRGRCFSSG